MQDPVVSPGKIIAFGWYGGKFSHLDWLLPRLPADAHHYCEPFGGSAAVLLNRLPAPVETYNDLDGEVVNFFRMLRERKEDIIEAIGLTPFSRAEYQIACARDESAGDLERARRFFIRARQTRTGLAQTASIGRWANCKNTTRRGMSGVVSRWLGSAHGLSAVAERLLRVQIESRPAADVIRLYDSPQTLFYCDPPYAHRTRGDSRAYRFEMDDREHRQLASVLRACKGRVAVSGYRCELMDRIYDGWCRHDAPKKMCHSVKTARQEALWTNFD